MVFESGNCFAFVGRYVDVGGCLYAAKYASRFGDYVACGIKYSGRLYFLFRFTGSVRFWLKRIYSGLVGRNCADINNHLSQHFAFDTIRRSLNQLLKSYISEPSAGTDMVV